MMMQSLVFPRSFLRLAWLCAVVPAMLALAACQGLMAGDAQAQRRAQVLREQGFQQMGDGWELQMSGKLLFGFNADTLDDERRDMVARMGRALADVDVRAMRVEGHADDQGTSDYNVRLSLRRAQAVAQILAEAGIPREHIDVRGHGAARPLVAGTSENARQENRRVALIVPAQ